MNLLEKFKAFLRRAPTLIDKNKAKIDESVSKVLANEPDAPPEIKEKLEATAEDAKEKLDELQKKLLEIENEIEKKIEEKQNLLKTQATLTVENTTSAHAQAPVADVAPVENESSSAENKIIKFAHEFDLSEPVFAEKTETTVVQDASPIAEQLSPAEPVFVGKTETAAEQATPPPPQAVEQTAIEISMANSTESATENKTSEPVLLPLSKRRNKLSTESAPPVVERPVAESVAVKKTELTAEQAIEQVSLSELKKQKEELWQKAQSARQERNFGERNKLLAELKKVNIELLKIEDPALYKIEQQTLLEQSLQSAEDETAQSVTEKDVVAGQPAIEVLTADSIDLVAENTEKTADPVLTPPTKRPRNKKVEYQPKDKIAKGIERTIEKAKKAARDRERKIKAEQIKTRINEIGTIPVTQGTSVQSPNSFGRSSLFKAKRESSLKSVQDQLCASDRNVSLIFSGIELSTDDQYIFLVLIKMAHSYLITDEFCWSTYQILQKAGMTIRDYNYKKLERSLKRLTKCTITLDTPTVTYHGHLIEDAIKNKSIHKERRWWNIRFNKKILQLFAVDYSLVDLEALNRLSSNMLAFKFYGYYQSLPDGEIKRNLRSLYAQCGTDTSFYKFKEQLIKAMPTIKEEFERNEIGVFDWLMKKGEDESGRKVDVLVVTKSNKVKNLNNEKDEQKKLTATIVKK